MNLFRKLANNIFFKLLLGLVAVSFVLFGISGFILGSPASWVLKVGSKTIGISTFEQAMQKQREVILNSNNSPEALQYLESDQFKSDILNQIASRVMIENLRKDFGLKPSKKLILSELVKEETFKTDGKFDQELFTRLLKRNGLNEEKYIEAISNEIATVMAVQTLNMVAPANSKEVEIKETFKQEKRLADIVTIPLSIIKSLPQPEEKELTEFFKANKENYATPEFRKISYIIFSKNDFVKNSAITDQEIALEYEKNKDQFKQEETRDFYNIIFDKESEAKDFITKLEQDKTNLKARFAKLAQELKNKKEKDITLNNSSKKSLIPELATPLFALAKDQHSEVLKSPFGYHVFLLNAIHPEHFAALSEVKAQVKQQLLKNREENILQTELNKIDDTILTSNSLQEVAKKTGLPLPRATKINKNGEDEAGRKITEIASLADFNNNVFTLKQNQISKIYSDNSGKFYVIKVEEVASAFTPELSSVKNKVAADLSLSNRQKVFMETANKIAEEIKTHPEQIASIAAKYQLKFEKNREYPRIHYIDYQGQKIPYQNDFLKELFSIKLGEATSLTPNNPQEFVVGVLRSIKSYKVNAKELEKAVEQAKQSFMSDVMQEFNQYMTKKHPVKFNEKVLSKTQGKDES